MKAQTYGPNPEGDEDKGWALLSVCWALVLVAFITTLIRVWIRVRITRNMGVDDIVMIITMATTILGAGLISGQVFNGLGRHMYYLTAGQRRREKIIGWADWMQAFITLGMTKISICLFLLRIVEDRRIVRGMYAIIGFTILFTSVCVFLFLGVCRPLRAYWDIGVDGTCLSDTQIRDVVISQGVLSIITDLICAALPAIFLRNLQINRRTKIGLCALMGLGVITAICCTVRTVLSGAVADPDFSWAMTTNVAWRIPEVNVGIICANAPILRPLYLFFRGRLQSQRYANATSGNSKERIWPSNAQRVRLGTGKYKGRDEEELGEGGTWHHSSGDTAVEIEMGLPVGENGAVGKGKGKDIEMGSFDLEGSTPPAKEKGGFRLGNGGGH